MIYSLYILNNSGGLIFYQDFGNPREHSDSNISLKNGSLFDTFQVLAAKISPIANEEDNPDVYLNRLDTDFFSLRCINSKTG